VSDVEGAPETGLSGLPLPTFDAPIRDPKGYVPARRPGSVRRTMTLDAVWPEGQGGPVRFFGDCRDVWTDAGEGEAHVIAADHIDCIAEQRTIRHLESVPPRPGLDRLAGARAGGHLRAAAGDLLAEEKRLGAPIYLLIDDLAGATLVSGWAWAARRPPTVQDQAARTAQAQDMAGVCIGFRPGSSALKHIDEPEPGHAPVRVVPLVHPADPDGWHPLEKRGGVNFRRARWIDLWREGDLILVESGFQDSASAADGGDRVAVHEYRLTATVDARSGVLQSIVATPGTLPYAECRAAPVNIGYLAGTPMADLRMAVLELLRRTAGCTYLNDMMRALAEVPALAAHIR
jgi:hypothetical protein